MMELDGHDPTDKQHKKKIRTENRERKKRWREANEDRNKDNDLRCRVHKRAHKLYGKENSRVKEMWIEEEFNKRKHKRQEKEGKGPDGLPLIDGTDIADLDQEELSNAIMATLTSFTMMNGGDLATHSSELNSLLQKLTNDPDALKNMLSDKSAEKQDEADASERQQAEDTATGAQAAAGGSHDAPADHPAEEQAVADEPEAHADSNNQEVDLHNIDIDSIVGNLLGDNAASLLDDDQALLEGVATGAITLPPAPPTTTRSSRRSHGASHSRANGR